MADIGEAAEQINTVIGPQADAFLQMISAATAHLQGMQEQVEYVTRGSASPHVEEMQVHFATLFQALGNIGMYTEAIRDAGSHLLHDDWGVGSTLQPAAPFAGSIESEAPQTIAHNHESPYRDSNEKLRAQIIKIAQSAHPGGYEQIEGHLASGTSHHVFVLPPDGKRVIKIPIAVGEQFKKPSENEERVDWEIVTRVQRDQVEALQRGKGHAGIEQIVDHVGLDNEKGGAIICENVPGTTLKNLPPEDFDKIPQRHFDALIKTLGVLAELNLWFDDLGGRENIIYHPKNGFTLIDYTLGSPGNTRQLSADEVLGLSAGVLFEAPDGEALPQSARAFYKSYEKAFGKEEALRLKQHWKNRRYILPEGL